MLFFSLIFYLFFLGKGSLLLSFCSRSSPSSDVDVSPEEIIVVLAEEIILREFFLLLPILLVFFFSFLALSYLQVKVLWS